MKLLIAFLILVFTASFSFSQALWSRAKIKTENEEKYGDNYHEKQGRTQQDNEHDKERRHRIGHIIWRVVLWIVGIACFIGLIWSCKNTKKAMQNRNMTNNIDLQIQYHEDEIRKL